MPNQKEQHNEQDKPLLQPTGPIVMKKDFVIMLCKGISGLEIHNDTQGHNLNDEITLLPLFAAINSVKSEVALILQGSQGIGKNRFTDVLCELLAGYSIKNITDIDEFMSKFNSVVENIMLGIANELKNFGEARYSNMDALKSIITDNQIRINEKNQPLRTAENVMNLIMVTNNDFPIKIEANDRRYVVCRCKAVHKDDVEYFTSLSNEIQAIGTKESFHLQKRKRIQLEHHVHIVLLAIAFYKSF
ncbi:MAG: hypothetical protein EZS28_033429 [Streblomastix strix]|uniref:NrS-1 polymerase-like helicase domain-containing protein n=1 Tax=Streblomastix strix TaxID=222440 RepID=A0A5J4ULE9_9EUKA|nr:MAG: hypothetical protein EZS28_033429 [Streblomastix strix]